MRAVQSKVQHLGAGPQESSRHLQHQLFLALKRKEGLLLDVQPAIVGISRTLDAFKGVMLVLMVFSQVVVLSSTPELREQSTVGLWLCNMAAVLCPTGLAVVFGYTCYSQHLRDWPDTTLDRRLLSLATIAAGPLAAAWICNFALHFAASGAGLRQKGVDGYAADAADLLSMDGLFGVGPDLMITCSVNYIVVSLLWEPLRRVLAAMPSGLSRDAFVLVLALLPVCFTQVELSECGGRRWVRHLALCADGVSSNRGRTVPALPYLFPFSLGMLLAGCWERFCSELEPIMDGTGRAPGPASASRRSCGSLHLVPFAVARRWMASVACALFGLALLFVPIGQQWFSADLSSDSRAQGAGHRIGEVPLALGGPGQPTAVWLLGCLWPVAIVGAATILMLVWAGRSPDGEPRGDEAPRVFEPVEELQHLGRNLLYYVTFFNVLLVGMTHACDASASAPGAGAGAGPLPRCESGFDESQQVSVLRCFLGAGGVLVVGRFLIAAAAASRK